MPCLQVLLSHSIRSSGSQTWWAKHTWRAPSGNTVRYPWLPGSQAIGGCHCSIQFKFRVVLHENQSKSPIWPPSMCMFSWRSERQMPTWSHQSGLWISLNPKHWGDCTSLCNPPSLHLVRGVCQNPTKFLAKLGPEPSKSMALSVLWETLQVWRV